MGMTISSKNHSCDMGYGGFKNLRELVASKINTEFYEHYLKLTDAMFIFEGREQFFKDYNKKTEDFIDEKKICEDVANFLYQSDCDGKVDKKQAKKIYELIKNEDDAIIFGYSGRDDCATMKDIKLIFSEGKKVEWG